MLNLFFKINNDNDMIEIMSSVASSFTIMYHEPILFGPSEWIQIPV